MRYLAFPLFLGTLVVGIRGADVAVRTDGQHTTGTLTLEKTGKLLFTPAGKRDTVSLGDIAQFRLTAGDPPVFRGAPAKVLRLAGDQHLTGVFLGLEKDKLLLRTAWAERLAVPRSAAVALTHLPGWRPVVVEDFRNPLTGWTVQGSPTSQGGTIVLKKIGQSLSRAITPPLPAGRIGVSFREEGKLAGARYLVEAKYAVKGGERVMRVTVAGEEVLAVDAGGLAGTAQRVASAAGWRRLVIDFTTGSLRIRCDDAVLWFTLLQGPGGSLKQVRILCAAPDKPVEMKGGVAFADFVVERAVAEQRRPPGEPGQDELWLAGGDQVFGQVVQADDKGIELKGRFGKRRFAWSDLRGWFLKREKPVAVAGGRGPAVRVWLRTGLGPTLDVLEGTLTALDARQIGLRHPGIGEVSIPRRYVARLRPIAAES